MHDNIYRTSDLEDEKAFTWRLWVTGTTQLVRLRLRNFTPSSCSIQGGPDQLVWLRGGKKNAISRRVVKGTAKIDILARVYQEDPRLEAREIARNIESRLSNLEEEWHQRLSWVSPTVLDELLATLDWFERRTIEILDYRELQALRDHVTVHFSGGREELRRSHPFLFSNVNVKIAALSQNTRSYRDDGFVSILDIIPSGIKRSYSALMDISRRRNLLLDLCVISTPKSAEFIMHPASAPRDRRQLTTDSTMLNVYRGIYFYEMYKDSAYLEQENAWFKPIVCHNPEESDRCQLDLVLDSRPVLNCLLLTNYDSGSSSCRREDAKVDKCTDKN